MSESVLRTVGLGDPLSRVKGFLKPVAVVAGAAGTAAVTLYTVPGDEIARLVSVRFAVVTDANAANRTPVLQIQDADGNVIIETGANVNVTASLTWQINAFPSPGVVGSIALQRLLIALPDVFMYPGMKLVANNLNGQAGDVVGPARLLIEHLDQGGLGYDLGRVMVPAEER